MAVPIWALFIIARLHHGYGRKSTTDISISSDYNIQIDDSAIKCRVSDKFISIAMGVDQLNGTDFKDIFYSTRLRNLLKALSPAYFNIGGEATNFVTFEYQRLLANDEKVNAASEDTPIVPINRHPKKALQSEASYAHGKEKEIHGKFVLSSDLLDRFYELINSSGFDMIFNLNAFRRRLESNQWDSRNAAKMFKHAVKKNYKIIWQLGNEPNNYGKSAPGHIDGAQVGRDYLHLIDALKRANLTRAEVVGPEVSLSKGTKYTDKWITDFLFFTRQFLQAFSWHQYNINNKMAIEDDFLSPTVLDEFDKQCKTLRKMLRKKHFKKPIWLTETGSSSPYGEPYLSNMFVSVFPYLDKLGLGGENCVDVVGRHGFLGGFNALFDAVNYTPVPDYFVAVLFKELVGREVLRVRTIKSDNNFRIYARCSKRRKSGIPGDVTVFIINLNDVDKVFSFTGFELFKVKQYLLTGDAMTASTLRLNGKPLKVNHDDVPKMDPVVVKQPIGIPPKSLGFYQLEGTNVAICA